MKKHIVRSLLLAFFFCVGYATGNTLGIIIMVLSLLSLTLHFIAASVEGADQE